MKITVIGTGYVGLVTGTCLAEFNHQVVCVDIDKNKIKKLQKGLCPIYEPGLENLILKNLKAKRLSFTTNLKGAVQKSEIIFITVGTPSKEDGTTDLSYVEKAAKDIGQALEKLPAVKRFYRIIINKSTVPIGTGNLVTKIVKKYYSGNLEVVSNPEFLREGSAVGDFLKPDRAVIGAESYRAIQIVKKLYQPLKCPILITDLKTAEMIKYASNAFLATSISFINTISSLCEKVGADVTQVAAGMKLDKRIGKRAFLDAGMGYGGSCFPKDVQALISMARENYTRFEILEAVEKINEEQKKTLLEKLESQLPNLGGKKIALWGVAFKPQTDDIRQAPALKVIEYLLEKKAKVFAFDPVAESKAKKIFPQVKFKKSPDKAAKNADALLICTQWPIFQKINLPKIKNCLKPPHLVIDGRNIYSAKIMEKLGFQYFSVGRQMLEPKVSIIIPVTTINHYLLKTVGEILNLDWRNWEIIILPNKLSGEDKRLSEQSERIKIVYTGQVSPAEKRDLALNYATGEILAFLDDDAYPKADWLKKATPHFRNPAVGAVGGPAITAEKAGLWEKVSGAVYESLLGGGTARFRYLPTGQIREVDDFPSVNLLVLKDIFFKIGGFASQFWPGEDTKFCRDLVYSLGKKIIYDPQVVVYHRRRTSLWEHLRQVASYATHRGFFAKKFPETSLRPAYFAPSLFILLILGTLGFLIKQMIGPATLATKINDQTLWTMTPLAITAILFILYGLGILVSFIQTVARYKNILVGFLTAPAIFLTHVVYGIGFIVGLFKRNLKSKLREV